MSLFGVCPCRVMCLISSRIVPPSGFMSFEGVPVSIMLESAAIQHVS